MSAQELLVARAQRLSQASALLHQPVRTVELLCFQIAGERYALETCFAFSVMQRSKPAILPGAPPHFLGILSVQGETVPIVDLAFFWGKAARRSGVLPAVILGVGKPEFAILVDSLDELVVRPEKDLARAPALDDHHEFVSRLFDGVSIIDGNAVLEDPRFSINPATERTGT